MHTGNCGIISVLGLTHIQAPVGSAGDGGFFGEIIN